VGEFLPLPATLEVLTVRMRRANALKTPKMPQGIDNSIVAKTGWVKTSGSADLIALAQRGTPQIN